MFQNDVWLLIFTIFLVNVGRINGANILITEDLASKSHQIWNYAVADALATRGHNVTILGPKSVTLKGHEKFHNIFLEGLTELAEDVYNIEESANTGIYKNLLLVNEFPIFTCNYSLHTNGFKFLMNYPKDFKFDLILADITLSYCLLPLSQRFNFPPAMGLTAFLLPSPLSEEFGNTFHPSYLPFELLKFSDEMGFLERLQNYIVFKADMFLKYMYYLPKIEQVARQGFGDDMQPLDRLANRLSLLLTNLSPGFHYPRPISPNIIPVGGLHINPNKKLPQDLQKIMDRAKHGVILFALGSNFRSDAIRPEKKKAILEVFGQLKQTVLWKFESELTGVPKNVHINKWLPQSEILAHPNMKLFISHGGALSTIEAAYYGVPIIGMPFFVDQHYNIALLERKKLGVKLEYNDLTKETLMNSIQEILQNPSYSEEMKRMSEIMKDQQQTPMERAVFWIEYIMRHNGTHIFDPKSRHLSLFVSSSTDVLLFLLVLFCLILYITCKIVSFIYSFFGSNSRKIKRE